MCFSLSLCAKRLRGGPAAQWRKPPGIRHLSSPPVLYSICNVCSEPFPTRLIITSDASEDFKWTVKSFSSKTKQRLMLHLTKWALLARSMWLSLLINTICLMPSICHRSSASKHFPSLSFPTLASLNGEAVPSSVATDKWVTDKRTEICSSHVFIKS